MAFSTSELETAHALLPDAIKNTPLVRGRTPGLTLKLETLQPTGSYKIRAAWTALVNLGASGRDNGVALSSSGNFAGAFTWAAERLNVPAHLVFTPSVSGLKVGMAEEYPCQIHRCEDRYEARYEVLEQLSESGILTIDHRSDRNVHLGHATIGWECGEHLQGFERVLVPVSTGGLAIGVASALRARGFEGEIWGVQPSGNDTAARSWQADRPVQNPSVATCCDALTATSLPQAAFDELKRLLDGILVVDEATIPKAVKHLALNEGVIAEPGAAVGMAALLEKQKRPDGTLLILSGRNIEPTLLSEYLSST